MRILLFLIVELMALLFLSFQAQAGERNYLVAAPATVDLEAVCSEHPGYEHTVIIGSPRGSMTWLKCEGYPDEILAAGCRMLGSTYSEVFSDPDSLGEYNAIFQPDSQGSPRPFGVFMGCEKEMGL
ncbi:MAG TPA: hypothetical protein VGK71_08435 [Nitrospirota bacterium]|jgi:hypothetical protein